MSESSIEESINLGAMGEALNDKMDRDGLNANINPAAGYGVDYVVEWQTPTAENSYTWYRKYASGWVEQGGYETVSGSPGTVTVTLMKAMANTNYTIITSDSQNTSSGDGSSSIVTDQITTSQFKISWISKALNRLYWEIKGMTA